MDAQGLCQNCGAPLAADAPRGLCPACLMKVALAGGTAAEREKPGFTSPTIEELARKFPQLELIELIGRGGMGAVYKARQKELDRMVALKILPPGVGDAAAFAERFTREAKALARLSHPGIVTIHDFGRVDGLYFFVMEFVDGVNLRQLLASGGVSPREALAIVPQICDALQFAHDQGIVHRDIKPENILLDRNGRVKVADFGLAKLIGKENEVTTAGGGGPTLSRTLTEADTVMGTPRYMAPEQAEHPARVDHRADIYALGVVFYQMLTGELPGKRLDPPSKKVQMDIRLDEVVLRALEKEPERRYQPVSEVRTALETILQTASPDASKGTARPERGATPPKMRSASRAGGWPKYAYLGIAAGIVALPAIWFCLHLVLRSPGALGGSGNRGPVKQASATMARQGDMGVRRNFPGAVESPGSAVKQVSATTARQGDIGVYLDALGTVESLNSVTFAITEDDCQEVIKKFGAHQALTVEAYNRQFNKRFGHGLLTGVDNQIDTAAGTLKCRASLIPDGENLMVPGLFLNIRMLMKMKHGVTLVPAGAIFHEQQSAFAWVVQSDHTVTRRPVGVGAAEGKWVEIHSGLSPGEVVASGGLNDLHEGEKVRYGLAPKAD